MTAELRSDLSPVRLFLDGFDWRGKSSRRRFLIILAITIALVGATFFLFSTNQIPAGGYSPYFAVMAVLMVPFLGHAMRRLNDMGKSGLWLWLFLVPLVMFAFLLWLSIGKSAETAQANISSMRRAGFAFACIIAALLFSRAFWTPFWIPAGSMKPALLVGDFVITSPLRDNAQRGDIVVFTHPVNGSTFIKRVVGLEGDTVQLQNGVVLLNGQPLPQHPSGTFEEVLAIQGPARSMPRCSNGALELGQVCLKERFTETLPNGRSYPVLNIGDTRHDTTEVFTVPEGHLFMLGDNRDNSFDSRFPQEAGGLGFVPKQNLLYRTKRVLFSSRGTSMAAFWTWRPDRFFVRLP